MKSKGVFINLERAHIIGDVFRKQGICSSCKYENMNGLYGSQYNGGKGVDYLGCFQHSRYT